MSVFVDEVSKAKLYISQVLGNRSVDDLDLLEKENIVQFCRKIPGRRPREYYIILDQLAAAGKSVAPNSPENDFVEGQHGDDVGDNEVCFINVALV